MKYTKKKKIVELENKNEKEISMKKDLFEGTEQTQKVVATAKKHNNVFGRALASFVAGVAIVTCVIFAGCNKKDNNKTTNGITPPTTQQGEQTSGNQGGQTGGNQGGQQTGGNQGGQTGGEQTGGNQGSQENQGGNQGGETGGNQGGNQGGQETGGNQGGQTGGEQTGGNQGGQETGGNQGGETGGETNPEKPADKTPAEYKAECEQKLVDAVSNALQTKYKRSGKISNVELVKMNLENGKIYARAVHTQDGLSSDCFYGLESNLGNISNNSYKEISNKCDSISLSNIERSYSIKSLISEDKYNALCNYVLGEYDLQDSEILNVTNFVNRTTTLTVLFNNKIYTVKAFTHSAPSTDQASHIDYMLNSETNEISLVSQENFKDFDNIVSAEAGISSYKIKLGGKTLFSKTNGNIVYNNDFGMGM